MNPRLTRRRFVQIALAGGAVLSGAPAARKLFAQGQTSTQAFLGVRAGPVPTTNDVPEVGTTEIDPGATTPKSGIGVPLALLVESLDVGSGQLQVVSTVQTLADGTPILRAGDVLTGATTLADGTLVLTVTPAETGTPTRLIVVSSAPKAVPVQGLKKDEELASLVGTAGGGLTGLVMKKNGTPPAKLVTIDLTTGAISASTILVLPGTQRFRTLAQCPDGTLYSTAVGRLGDTTLVRLDLSQHIPVTVAQLTSGGTPWNNGLASLVCSGTGELLALGAPRYLTPNAIYSVDTGTGVMTKLYDFDVAEMAPTHS